MPKTTTFYTTLLSLTSLHAQEYLVLNIGGESSSSVLALDPGNLKERDLDIEVQRYGHGSVYYRNLVIVCGGFDQAIGRITPSCAGYNTTVSEVQNGEGLNTGQTPNDRMNNQNRPGNVVRMTSITVNLVDIPQPLQYFSLTLFEDHLYAIGGLFRNNDGDRIRLNNVYRMNLQLEQAGNTTVVTEDTNWENMPELLTARSSCNCQPVDKVLYCFGGIGQDGARSADMEEFRSEEFRWLKGAEMSLPRSSFSSTVYENKIYATGGKNLDMDVERTIDVYHIEHGYWRVLNVQLNHARYYHTTFVINGMLMVRGGTHPDTQKSTTAQRTLEALDLQNRKKQDRQEFYVVSGFQSKVTHTSVLVPKDSVAVTSKLLDWPIYVGIAIGCMAGVLCLLLCCYCCCRHCICCDCCDCCYYDEDDEEYEDDEGPPMYGDYKI